jgi:hypothetical protein
MKRLLIGFFLLQLLIDLAHSVTVFPFVHYGMFSQSLPRPDSIPVFEVTVDGQRLRAIDFSIYQWDMVQTPLAAAEQQVHTRDFAFDKEKMSSGLQLAGLGGLYRTVAPNLDNAPGTATLFPQWYKAYLSNLVGHPIRTVQVDKVWYRYTEGHYLLLKKETRIAI